MTTPTAEPDAQTVWHTLSAAESPHAQSVDARVGLSHEEAIGRLQQFGKNSWPDAKRRGPGVRFLLQFYSPLIYLLLTAQSGRLAAPHGWPSSAWPFSNLWRWNLKRACGVGSMCGACEWA